MREGYGNIWDLVQPTEAMVITTNGTVTNAGRGVMGRGIALEAKQKVPGIDRILGDQIQRHGNHVWAWMRGNETRPDKYGPPYGMIFMPVKHHWHQPADPKLIVQSAHELVELADKEQALYRHGGEVIGKPNDPPEWANIWMPRPGCGNGRLNWALVKPLIEDILDDRFIAVTFGD